MKRSYLLFFLLGFVLTSCVGENYDSCVPRYDVDLNFRYLDVPGTTDIFPNHVGRVNVGVFDDATGRFVLARTVNKSDLDKFQGARLSLTEGQYTAVCWGNISEAHSYIDNSCDLGSSSEVIYNPNYKTSDPIPSNDSLYYGKTKFSVSPAAPTSRTVDFKPAHVKLRVDVRGLQHINPPLADINDFSVRVTDLHPAYDHDMVTCGTMSTYYPKVEVDNVFQEASALCNILRFDGLTNTIEIQVAADDSSAPIYTIPLNTHMTNYGITIVDGQELAIGILITFRPGDLVTVTVSPWEGKPTQPGDL